MMLVYFVTGCILHYNEETTTIYFPLRHAICMLLRLSLFCPDHCAYRRYLYHQGNEQTTGGTVEAAAKP